MFSIVMPARNEAENLPATCRALAEAFHRQGIADYELVVVNDGSTDGTEAVLRQLETEIPQLRSIRNGPPHGYGLAVRRGLAEFRGDAVAVVMADLSDSPEDVVAYYRAIQQGAECVFGSRFMKGSRVVDYPSHKLLINRLANTFIRILFRLPLNDVTNAFKAYRREVIQGIQPLLSHHFNLTVEMPLKALVRGYRFVTMPISWTNRTHGISKLKIKEMGSRYLFIVLYVWLERALSRGDYQRRDREAN